MVERTHSWLNRYRHLLIRWAKKPENYLALLPFSFAHLTGTVAYWDSLLVLQKGQYEDNGRWQLVSAGFSVIPQDDWIHG